ncbi:hypothetical protein ACFW35_13030 [Fictibacillus sp. NPDC058756]|uniref:hypothetical protein n=1 Tax=Fictibacillus sp. NPDC058756 TaxID=3346625 RepID=UPI0036A7F1B2
MQENFFQRKMMASIVTTITLAMVLASMSLKDNAGSTSDYGEAFLAAAMLYGTYGGVIILVYGSLVSGVIEFVMNRWFKINTPIYILFHGVFGLIMLEVPILAVFGVASAILYALIDRWILFRINKDKPTFILILTPFALFTMTWSILSFITPDRPHFTAEDAVEFVTSGKGTIIDKFPKAEGVITVGNATRETSVKEIGDEVYIVTFTETWKTRMQGGRGRSPIKWNEDLQRFMIKVIMDYNLKEVLTLLGIGWVYPVIVIGIIIIVSFIKLYLNLNWKLYYTAFGQENYFKVVSQLQSDGIKYKVKVPLQFDRERSFNDNTQYDIYVKKDEVHRASIR